MYNFKNIIDGEEAQKLFIYTHSYAAGGPCDLVKSVRIN